MPKMSKAYNNNNNNNNHNNNNNNNNNNNKSLFSECNTLSNYNKHNILIYNLDFLNSKHKKKSASTQINMYDIVYLK